MWLRSVSLLALLALSVHGQADRPIINTSGGQVQGTTESCGLFCTYYSFKGIPYAEPPVGTLRFADPVTHGGWTGVRDASQHGSSCPSPDIWPTEAEDCLYLNVYSSSLVGTRPVMVFIHGGGFVGGSGDVALYDSRYFMPEDVVIVTINYRLGVLGFLSTGDRSASGNWAIKDCVEALQWVQRNIVAFGGDPSQVTIFGQSAGAALVHFLILSPLTAGGLFHRAISLSGSPLGPWSLQSDPRTQVNRLATTLGISTSDTAAMVTALRQVPFRDLVALQGDAGVGQGVPLFLRPLDFAVVVEPADAPGPVALDRLPIEIIDSGSYRAVPLMTGFVDMDALLFSAAEMVTNPGIFARFNSNPHLLVPFLWNIPEGSAASTAVSQAFQQHYWQSQPLSAALLAEFSVYLTDHQFTYPQFETAKRHAARAPVYVYEFRYDGDLNLMKQFSGITLPGAVHGDEVCYMFYPAMLGVVDLPVTSHAITVRQRMVRMWTNFGRYGTPTPSADSTLQNVIWRPISSGMIDAMLNIGHDLVMETNPMASRYNQWLDLAQRYANNIFRP